MARFTFGGEITHLLVSEDAGNADALVVAPATAIAFYDEPGGSVVTDFLTQDGGGSYTVAETEIESGTTGHLPFFQGPDGVTVLHTPADPEDLGGQWLRLPAWDHLAAVEARVEALEGIPAGTDLTAYSQVEALTGYPESFPAIWGEIAEKPELVTPTDLETELDERIGDNIPFLGELAFGEEPDGAAPLGFYLRPKEEPVTPPSTEEITFAWVAVGDGTGSVLSASAQIDAGATVGQFMLGHWVGPATDGIAFTDPAGWTLVSAETVPGVTTLMSRLYRRVVQAGDAGDTVTVSYSGVTAGRNNFMIVAYDGVSALDGTPAASGTNTSGATKTIPTVETVGEDCVGVTFICDRSADGLTTWTPPAGWTERGEGNQTGTAGRTHAVADDLTQVPSTTEIGGDTWTRAVNTGADPVIARTVILRPIGG